MMGDYVMNDEAKKIPDINEYGEILKASHRGRLVVFLGSGISALLGYRNWKEYADAKVEWLYKKEYINFHDKEKLKSLDAKKILSICDIIFQEKSVTYSEYNEKDFLFKVSNEHNYNNDEIQIYKDLYEFNAVYITTNYDDCLDKIANGNVDISINGKITENSTASQRKVFFLDDDFTSPKLTLPGNVFHIHGSVNSAESMVITVLDYIKRYARDTKLENFLTSIFQEYTVLFIGYGLEEMEILDFIVSTGRRKNSDIGNVIKHYALFPTFLDEKTMFGFYDKFYNKLGIKLIPYYKDECGYVILGDIIKKWSEVIRNVAKKISLSDKIAFVDECLSLLWENIGVKKDELCELIILKGNEDVRGYFFKKLNDEKWFDYLNKVGFFKLTTNFEPLRKEDNGQTLITMPFWDEITYVHRISEKIKNKEIEIHDETRYIAELIEFIRNVDAFANNNKIRDNSMISYNLIKIFTNLPSSSYKVSFLKHIEKWIYTKYDRTMVLSELTKTYIPKLLSNREDKDAVSKATGLLGYILRSQFIKCDGTQSLKEKIYWINQLFEKNYVIIAKISPIEICTILIECTLKQIRKKEFLSSIEIAEMKLKISAIIDDKDTYDIFLDNDTKKVNCIKFNPDDITYDKFEKTIYESITKEFEIDVSLINKSKEIWNFFWMLFSKGASGSIYNIDCRSEYRFENYENTIYWLRNILIETSNDESYDIKNIIENLINSNYMLLKKVGLVVIAESNNEKLRNMFFKVIKRQYSDMLFNGIYTADELKHLLNKLNNITHENKVLIKDIIEKGPFNYWTNEKEEILRWKQERYEALSHIFINEYEAIKKETGRSDIGLHPGIGKLRTTTGWGKSPLTQNKILEINNQTLVEKIRNFVSGDSWNYESTANGFAMTLGSAIKKNPRKFFNDLPLFCKIEYIYTYEILNGLREYIKIDDNMSFCWKDVLLYIQKIIEDKEFWENKYIQSNGTDRMNANYQWVLSSIFELIREGIECNNSHNLEKQSFIETFKVFKIALSKLIGKEVGEKKAYNFDDMINDTLCKGISGAIELNYKMRKFDKNKSSWIYLKRIHEMCLKKSLGKVQTVFGYNLVYIYAIDSIWANHITVEAFSTAVDYLRDSFMLGYLAQMNIDWNAYDKMFEFYEKYLSYYFNEDKHARQMLVQHITLAYLDKTGNKYVELFNKLVDCANADDINNIIDFLCYKNRENKSTCKLVLTFWKKLYDRLKIDEKLDSDKEKLLANTVKMGKFIMQIDEKTFKLLLAGAKNSQKNYTACILLDELGRLVENTPNNPKYIAEIFKAMCNGEFYLLDYDEKLTTIYKFLLDQKDQSIIDIASDINNTYLAKNNEKFKELWLKHRTLED